MLQDPAAYEQLIKTAEDFIAKRALTHVGNITPQPVVHIVKVRCCLRWCAVCLPHQLNYYESSQYA